MSQQKLGVNVGIAICIALIWGLLSIPALADDPPSTVQAGAEKNSADEPETEIEGAGKCGAPGSDSGLQRRCRRSRGEGYADRPRVLFEGGRDRPGLSRGADCDRGGGDGTEELSDCSRRCRGYRQFALEWVQRFKDRERSAQFFSKAIEVGADNGADMRSLVAAFAIVREIYGAKSDWNHILSLADTALARADDEQKLFVALQAGMIAWKELDDPGRARGYFSVARQDRAQRPGRHRVRGRGGVGRGAA